MYEELMFRRETQIRNLQFMRSKLEATQLELENLKKKTPSVLDTLGIDSKQIKNVSDLRKAVYKETPTTVKLKELEIAYDGPVTKDAGIQALQGGNYMLAAFISRKLEESSNEFFKKNNSRKRGNKASRANI